MAALKLFDKTKEISQIAAIFLILSGIAIFISCSSNNHLAQALKNPESVIKLTISNSKIDSLPPEIGYLTNLRVLILFRDGLKYIPKKSAI